MKIIGVCGKIKREREILAGVKLGHLGRVQTTPEHKYIYIYIYILV